MTFTPTMDHVLCSEEDHSPPLSENAGGGSWLHWENEISSISGLNIDSTTELNGLVEDKEVAARAVALVVNSTRKGIVPLCADIASLLRAKRSLEKKVYLLKRDLEALRSSTSVSFRTSHSTSPTLPLIDQHGAGHGQDRSRPCSRCSQCSVTGATGHSSTIINTTTTTPTTTTTNNTTSSTRQPQQHLSSPSVSRPASTRTSPRPIRTPARGLGSRKNSLPEMTSEPATEVKRVSPKISKGTQCACVIPVLGDTPLEEQFLETVRLNSKLSEELGSARKEIEFLKGRLKELEMKQLARECSSHEQYRMQSRDKDVTCGVTSDPLSHAVAVMTSCRHAASKHRRPKSNGLPPSHRVSAPPGSLLYAEPLYGCKCSACDEAMGSDIHTALSAALNQELQKFPISSNTLVQLGDHVVIKGEKTGRIRYIGHLDKIGQPNMVFVGLELDAPVGHHDGFFNNKRYFFCHKDHGLFVPLHDMVCKVCEKTEPLTDNKAGVTTETDHTSTDHNNIQCPAPDMEDHDHQQSSMSTNVHSNAVASTTPRPPHTSGYDDEEVEMTSLTSHGTSSNHKNNNNDDDDDEDEDDNPNTSSNRSGRNISRSIVLTSF